MKNINCDIISQKNFIIDLEQINPNKKIIYNMIKNDHIIKEGDNLEEIIELKGITEDEVILKLQISFLEFKQVLLFYYFNIK